MTLVLSCVLSLVLSVVVFVIHIKETEFSFVSVHARMFRPEHGSSSSVQVRACFRLEDVSHKARLLRVEVALH